MAAVAAVRADRGASGVRARVAGVLLWRVNLGQVSDELRHAKLWWLIPASFFNIVSDYFRAIRWREFLRPLRTVGSAVPLAVALIGVAVNLALPLRAGRGRAAAVGAAADGPGVHAGDRDDLRGKADGHRGVQRVPGARDRRVPARRGSCGRSAGCMASYWLAGWGGAVAGGAIAPGAGARVAARGPVAALDLAADAGVRRRAAVVPEPSGLAVIIVDLGAGVADANRCCTTRAGRRSGSTSTRRCTCWWWWRRPWRCRCR